MVDPAHESALQEEVKRLRQDVTDMHNCPHAYFVRCPGCHRLHSNGLVCPDGTKPGCVE